jgi:hypothetical protein
MYVSPVPLATLLNNRFAKKELEGKNVNIDMEMSKATTINDMGVLAKRLYLFDNLIEFASGIKTIEVSGIHKYLCPRYGSID